MQTTGTRKLRKILIKDKKEWMLKNFNKTEMYILMHIMNDKIWYTCKTTTKHILPNTISK